MLLKSLTLRNYRKYKDASVEFPDGIIGIIGLNGVGKTTLVEAIGWVLFGHHAARTTKELIKREGASPHEPCFVALEFELEGDRYEVVREMVGKNLVPKASLVINGKLITNDADEVTGVIEEKIGMDYLSFFTSVFARQKELNALSAMKAADRKKLVLRMLGIERIEGSIQAIREDKRGKEKRIEGIKAATVDKEGRKKIDVLKSKHGEAENAKKALAPIIKEIEASTRIKEQEVEDSKEDLERATRTYERYVALNNNLGERRSDLDNVRKRREEREKELNDLLTKKKKLYEISDKEAHYFQLREKKEELDALREQYQRKCELMKREERTSLELQKRETNISGLKQQSREFEGIETVYESQKRFKGEMEELKERYQQKEELMRREASTMREIGNREEKARRLKDERKEFEGIEEEVEAVKRMIDELQKQKEGIHSSLGDFKSRVDQKKEEIEESKRKRKEIEELGPEGECPMCERKLEAQYERLLKKLHEEIQTKTERLDAIFNDYKAKKEELASKEREEELLIQRDKELDKRVVRRRALDVEIEHEERELRGWGEELKVIIRNLEPLEAVKFDENKYKEVVMKLSELEKRMSTK